MSFVTRRQFIQQSAAGATALGLFLNGKRVQLEAAPLPKPASPNDRVNVGFIGYGIRGCYLMENVKQTGQANLVAVADCYQGHLDRAKERTDDAIETYFAQYKKLLDRKDLDAVVIATPDHWHTPMVLDAVAAGKDVYIEKPMTYCVEEGPKIIEAAKRTNRMVQVGSQWVSAPMHIKAKEIVQSGKIGKVTKVIAFYNRNSSTGAWNYPIPPDLKNGVNFQWEEWLGPAPKRPFDAERVFRYRKYWDYSGGTATDLFYHVVAPLNICWGEAQFPARVVGTGGNYVFKDEREVPDTFMLVADYAAGHSLVLSSSMANSHHIPGLIRGHEGTLIMVENGEFESRAEYITVIPELVRDPKTREKVPLKAEYAAKFGGDPIQIPVDQTDMMTAHIENFLACVRSRQKPHLDVETGARAQAVINLAVESYREGRVLYWDEKSWKASPKPVKA